MFEEIDDLNSSEFSEANPLAELVKIYEVIPHPNADMLDLVSPDGSNINFAVVKKGQFKKGDWGVWIDSVNDPMVPVDNPFFSFLQKIAKADGYARIKTLKLRGIVSRGLLIPALENWTEKKSREISEILKLKKYIALTHREGGSFYSGTVTAGPHRLLPTNKYDVESVNKKWKNISNGTTVYITEKIHGTNAAYGWLPFEGELRFWSRSRTLFKKEPEIPQSGGLWWDVAEKLSLKEKLSSRPGMVLYGEIYGKVQDLRYGLENDASFVAFDCWDSNKQKYLSWEALEQLCLELDIKTVPVITKTIWETSGGIPTYIAEMAEGKTLLGGDHVREGIVIRADIPGQILESFPSFSLDTRIIYKLVGNGYLTR